MGVIGRRRRRRRGQATIEYILLLSTIAMIYAVVINGFRHLGFTEKMTKTLSEPFARAYRHGHVEGRGYDDGGPRNHPRMEGGDNSFRLFINPAVTGR